MSSPAKPGQTTPPKWADRFLMWYCNPKLLDEIQGDAYEIFHREAKNNAVKARWKFTWNVIRFFRWRNIRKDRIIKPSSNVDMIKSYFLSGFRNMVRNAAPSLINIIGLSIAIGVAVTVFVLEDSYYDLDSMHTKSDHIALVVNHIKNGDETSKSARSPYPLAELLKSNTSVEMVARAGRTGASVRVGDKVFRERLFFADPEFMKIFDFKVVAGDRNSLNQKNQLLVSESIAIKYFENKNVVGQLMSIKFNDEYKYEFTIGGILEDSPANSSMAFDILVPSAVWIEMNKDRLDDWSNLLASNFILKKPEADWSTFNSELETFRKFQNQADAQRPIQKVELLPMKQVAISSWEISGSLSWSNSPAGMIAIVMIGVLVILLACFNYMNVAVASVGTRLKEIGVRKVIGGGKREIIAQFLFENLMVCFIALCFGTLLAYYLLVPGFNASFPVKIEFGVSSWQMAVAFFGGLLLMIALISGAYPSLYVSSFNAVKILKGKEKFGSKSKFSRSLLTIQFALSITSMVACMVFVSASYYFEKLDWGYKHDATLVVQLQTPKQYEEILAKVRSSQNFSGSAGTARHVGMSNDPANIIYGGKEYSARRFPVGKQYLDIMNIRLKEGRLLDENIESDNIESAVVNEKFVRKMGWTSAIGQTFLCDSVKRFVVGVVHDFYYDDFYNPLDPIVITMAKQDEYRYMVLKAEPGKIMAAEEELKSVWRTIAPDEPTAIKFQSAVFDDFVRNSKANNSIMFFIAGVSIFLAAMGLYGLVSYNLTRRLKEFSVRKVFGASVTTIFRLMTRDYIVIVLLAFGVGAPFGAYMMNQLLTAIYPTPIPINYSPYFISVIIMISVVGVTVLSQFRRVTKENPTETLRND